eukprot:m.154283 g.154283  ORF g.154283 m.154283 type:complete len:1056 (-) comp24623_c0_seq9:11-3178(-)
MTDQEQDGIFLPLFSKLAAEVPNVAVDEPKAMDIADSFEFLFSLPVGKSVVGRMLQNEVTCSALMRDGREMEMQGLGRYFSSIPLATQRLPPPPPMSVNHAADVRARIQLLQSCMEKMQQRHKRILHGILKDKTFKETLLQWVARLLEINKGRSAPKDRTTRGIEQQYSTNSLLINLTSVLLQLCEPFLDLNAKPHQDMKRLDYRWLASDLRIDMKEYPKFAGSESSPPDIATNSAGFDLDVQEASMLADAIALSLQTNTNASSSSNEEDIPKSYHFVTECFFLTLRAVNVALVPTIKFFREFENSFHGFIDAKIASGMTYPEITQLDQFHRMELQKIGIESMLGNNLLTPNLCRLYVLFSCWLQRLATREDRRKVFETLPEFLLHDMGIILSHIARFAPDILATSRDIERLLYFICEFIDPPDNVVQSAIARQGLADVILQFCPTHQKRGTFMASARMLEILFANPPAQEKLAQGLLQLYVDVGYVEGALEVFDKNSARYRIALIIQEMWASQPFRQAMFKEAKNKDKWHGYVKAMLSDAIFLFNDGLSRVSDVRGMQLQMADKQAWNAKPAGERMEGERYMAQIERTARSFLRFGRGSVELLRFLSSDPAMRELLVKDNLNVRVAQTLINFLTKLCGDRIKELKVQNPEKYGWDPKMLLRDVGSVCANFCLDENFLPVFVQAAEDPTIFARANHILTNKCGAGHDILKAFSDILTVIGQTNEKPNEAPSSSTGELALASEDDQKDVDLSECKEEYFKALLPLVYGEHDFSDQAGDEEDEEDDDENRTYSRHHFASNIAKSSGSVRQKVTRLLQENSSLAPNLESNTCSLPLAPEASVFMRCDEERMDVCKVLISGPIGTPYFGGLYEFHLYVPDAYPEVPPLFNLETTGNNQVRFNPNLYSCGKVCLSLLGTWHGGAKTGGWDKGNSTLLQVFVSVQSLIMVPEPYGNEPGYESQLGTPQGIRASQRYSDERRVASIKLAMVEQLRNPPAGFEDVVKTHFKILGPSIVEQCERWARLAHTRAVENQGEYDWGPDILKQTEALKEELKKLNDDS